jgi:hypothetical protein
MKPQGSANAIADISKLPDYCPDPQHPRGRHKPRVFLSAFYLGPSDPELLRAALFKAAREEVAVPGAADDYGDRKTQRPKEKQEPETDSVKVC